MNYSTHGPFKLKKGKNGLIDGHDKIRISAFWDNVRKDDPGLSFACGCYLFAINAAKGVKPWYVGCTGGQNFEHECFTSHKLNIYNQAIANRKCTPVLFFIAERTKNGKFVKPRKGKQKHSANNYLESLLIGASIDKNPQLKNIQKTKYLKNMCVPGFLNSPQRRPMKSESELKKALK